jgi:hypothetical protein
MCKEMPVIPVDRVVDKKRIIGKMEGLGGGEAQWVADPPPRNYKVKKLTSLADQGSSLSLSRRPRATPRRTPAKVARVKPWVFRN